MHPLRLEPHENPNTDIVLLGHSMGGILGSEVVLNPPPGATSSPPFRHHILGTINFDTPFLGMHPGLVGSGIASLFRPTPPPPGSVQWNVSAGNSTSSLASPGTPGTMTSESSDYASLAPTISSASSIVGNDPNYNPPFPNDIHIKERTGFNKFLHFARKHSDDFTTATKSYFMSHIEFGGCLADFPGLKKRYARIRELEDVDDTTDDSIVHDARRIRFVNYYTASTGVLKQNQIKNVLVKGHDGKLTPLIQSTSQLSISHERERSSEDSQATTPRISIEEHREGEVVQKPVRINTMGANALDRPSESEDDGEEPAMKQVKEQVQNMGDASGVKPAGAGDDELVPMQMVDAIPIMSDEEYDTHNDHTDNEYHDVQDEKTAEVKVEEKDVPAPAPDRAAPPPPQSNSTVRDTLEKPVVPSITRTPPTEPAFPPLPEVPAEPVPFDPAAYEDKDARKIYEKDHKRLVKQYEAAVKDRESAIKSREKLRQKREKQVRDEAEKQRKAEEKLRIAEEKAEAKEAEKHRKFEEKGRQAEREREKKDPVKTQKEGEELRLEQEALRMKAEAARMRGEAFAAPETQPRAQTPSKLRKSRTPSPSPSMPSLAQTTSTVSQSPSTSTAATREEKTAKPKKDRRFCLLPNDLTRSKEKDKCWVRVYMEGVDEVGAHCGLFFQGQQYESLVGDVGERIGSWVREDATRRMILEYRNVD